MRDSDDDIVTVRLPAVHGFACEFVIDRKGQNSSVRWHNGEDWHSFKVHDVRAVVDRLRSFVATSMQRSMTRPRRDPIKSPDPTSFFERISATVTRMLDGVTLFFAPRLEYELLASTEFVTEPELTLALEYRRDGQLYFLYFGAGSGGSFRWISVDIDQFEAFLKEMFAATRRR